MATTLVRFDRSLGDGSIFDCVDEMLQYVLYHRQQVPMLISVLLKAQELPLDETASGKHLMERRRREKILTGFRDMYASLRSAIANIVTSIECQLAGRFAIVIGGSATRPTDVYLLHIDDYRHSTSPNDRLSDSERRRMARQLIESGLCYKSCGKSLSPIQPSRTFFFVEASRETSLPGFVPKPELNWLPPADNGARNSNFSKVNFTRLNIMHKGVDTFESRLNNFKLGFEKVFPSEDIRCESMAADADDDYVWFQYQQPIVGFKELF